MANILIVDDEEHIRKSIAIYLSDFGHTVFTAGDGNEGLQVFKKESVDLVISDWQMPDVDGLELLETIKRLDPQVITILITAHGDLESTIKAIQGGVFDYLHKPIQLSQLKLRIDQALSSKTLSEQLQEVKLSDYEEYEFKKNIIGKSPGMREVYKDIAQLSLNKVTVLLQGESGTGKELISKIIHYSGVTKDEPFIGVNCSALAENLLESELFGHTKGSFTGAIKDKKGKFELAGAGTIFLDEISEISPAIQVKLLRVLQEREFERVGGESPVKMRARIIAATNRDLSKLVEEGAFREDLYYRLNVFKIILPPLRERKEDIPLLVMHFLSKLNKELHKDVTRVPNEVMEMLQNYEWVGNVRELENILTHALVLTKGNVLYKENILLSPLFTGAESEDDDWNRTLVEVEKEHIDRVLRRVNWDKNAAHKVLGISKPTLYHKMDYYDLKKPE